MLPDNMTFYSDIDLKSKKIIGKKGVLLAKDVG